MASEETMKKMIQAILDKRRELGLVDWGLIPIEDVLSRLPKKDSESETGDEEKNNLAKE
ncbi:MAG: hypothetical protein AB1656_23500 [Candidatus Omnitrophota bacterium]